MTGERGLTRPTMHGFGVLQGAGNATALLVHLPIGKAGTISLQVAIRTRATTR